MQESNTKPESLKDKSKNQVNVIFPYKGDYGIWAFDDPEVGLDGEVFVGNINTMLDILTENGDAATVYISKDPIASYNAQLIKVLDPAHGIEPGWYKLQGTNMTGWLCPALLKYFEGYPDKIFARIEKRIK